MRRIMAWIPLAGVLGLAAASPVRLDDFSAILNSLQRGENVRVVFHYARCRMVMDNREVQPVPDAVGGMNLETFEYFAPGAVGNTRAFLVASRTVLISHPRYGYVLNYVKVRVNADETVSITARYLDPRNLKVRMDENFYTRVDNGTNRGGASFFRRP